ncbi:hypothetical protein GSI_15673 [Ganoderma sinense ZZ0214-1]|uniref:Uncharacterized protein n=1 Tax=Ganoderma sinense ZZ0214-1 TaxID=1077348 RepID=A0A2G8RN86_9APHY|nr:hypothetical protein GSI_15673 [Ganoderma sinense ZZ0214-1]
MNSPTDHSPNSDSSSDNDIEDISAPTEQPGLAAGPSAPIQASFFGTSAPKRRLPGGLMMGGPSARDPKTRRKDIRPGGGGGYWDHHMGPGPSRGFKDDLVDTQIVDQLRQQFGDPFDESDLKSATN